MFPIRSHGVGLASRPPNTEQSPKPGRPDRLAAALAIGRARSLARLARDRERQGRAAPTPHCERDRGLTGPSTAPAAGASRPAG